MFDLFDVAVELCSVEGVEVEGVVDDAVGEILVVGQEALDFGELVGVVGVFF